MIFRCYLIDMNIITFKNEHKYYMFINLNALFLWIEDNFILIYN